jgi:hypothetical protein
MRWVLVVLWSLLGCESELSRRLDVTVPSGVAGGFSQTSPGIVLSDLGSPDAGAPYALLCGQTPSRPLALSQNLGFGCLSERPGLEGSTETVRAWVQPMPVTWDASQLCAQRTDRSIYDATSFGPADAGGSDSLATAPASTWAQGSGTGTWHRDGSPCGGLLSAKLTLATP